MPTLRIPPEYQAILNYLRDYEPPIYGGEGGKGYGNSVYNSLKSLVNDPFYYYFEHGNKPFTYDSVHVNMVNRSIVCDGIGISFRSWSFNTHDARGQFQSLHWKNNSGYIEYHSTQANWIYHHQFTNKSTLQPHIGLFQSEYDKIVKRHYDEIVARHEEEEDNRD